MPEVGQTVSHYRILKKLGRGGMGEVFLAEDTSLRRKVAVKFLSPERQQNQSTHHQILREARSAARLEHSNICTIHEVGASEGKDFIVMEYVDGQTLQDRLIEGPLPMEEALRIVIDVAEALEEAHEKGVIHQDLKPANIMLTRKGHAKVMDFGLAMKLVSGDGLESNAETLTSTSWGQKVGGTPAYMSPEQLLGESIDVRSDIFSLGIVFYEMLGKEHPFRAANSLATTDRILHAEPKPINKVNPEVPEEVGRLLGNMLAKSPKARPSSIPKLLENLRSLMRKDSIDLSTPSWIPNLLRRKREITFVIIGMVPLLLAVAVTLRLFEAPIRRGQQNFGVAKYSPNARLPLKKYLAVLPFEPVNVTSDHEAFGKGLTETVNSLLSKLTVNHPLQVVAASAMRDKSISTVQQASREFGVNLVLMGRLQQDGGKLRIDYVLVDAETEQGLRADTITAEISDTFDLEDKLIASVLSNLEVELLPEEKSFLAYHPTQQPSVYSYYLNARGYLQDYQKPESIQNAVDVLRYVLEQDPKFALAFAARGEARWYQFMQTKNMKRVEEALTDCNRAVTLDNDLASGHTCLGAVYIGTGRYEEAVQEYEHAIHLEPTSDDASRGLASAYEKLGMLLKAEEIYKRAIKLRPEYWAGYSVLAAFYGHQGRYDDAAEVFAQVTRLVPDHVYGWSNLGGMYLLEGNYSEAIQMLQHSIALRPTAIAFSNLGTARFYQRKFGEAAGAYREAIKINEREYVIWGNLGDAYHWDPRNRTRADAAYRQALLLGQEQLKVNPRDATLLGYMAYYYAMLNEKAKAENFAKKAIAMNPQNPELLFNIAQTCCQLGEMDQTLDWLKQAMAAGFSRTTIRDTPLFDNVWSAPEFRRLFR
jgi:serine/threonine protein kinase/tetratricopeptide (TPR) repeat protein